MIFFLKFKKILMLLTLILICFEANSQAGRHDESEDESCYSKTLRNLSNVFSFCVGDCIGSSARYHYKKTSGYDEDNEIQELVITETQPISILSNQALYQVVVYLSPSDIRNLIKSSKQFMCLRDNDFWLYYNEEHGYSSWHEKIPSIKVAFSYYWFKKGQLRKAAAIGFPGALAILKHQEMLKQENPEQYQIANFFGQNPYERHVLSVFSYGGSSYLYY